MKARTIARFLGVAVVMAWALPSAFLPSASADACPDVEVVFARGTGEPPGVGGTGQAFVDSLGSRVGAKSFNVYAVDYPASPDFPTAVDGIRDAGAHVESMAASCPKTKMVLGGFSQGAAVMGYVTSAAVPDGLPDGVDASAVPPPMPPEVASHVAAVTLFGQPSSRFMSQIGAPPVAIGPLYAPKTLQLCVPDDPICSDGGDFAAHGAYAVDGMVDEGADFRRESALDIGWRRVSWRLSAWLITVALLPACNAHGVGSGQTSPSHASTTGATAGISSTTAVAASPTTRNPRAEKWIDLQAGDCLADPAPTDPGVLTVTIVDCAATHAAEVYFRGPMAVNAAIVDVATPECAANFAQYTGHPVEGSPFTVTYLIDSNQDRTSDNPTPSTVICLLQAANAEPLTASARR